LGLGGDDWSASASDKLDDARASNTLAAARFGEIKKFNKREVAAPTSSQRAKTSWHFVPVLM